MIPDPPAVTDYIVPDRSPTERHIVRWVQYDAPLFVRVEPEERGWGTAITKVVLVDDPEDIHLARDATGEFLVYDENFERIDNLDTDVRIDAVSVAEDRHRWPEGRVVALSDDWDTGPDPRGYPEYYLDAAELAKRYPEEFEDEDEDGQPAGLA